MKIKRFEEIEAWQAARVLVNMVYEAVNKNENFNKDFRLAGQIQGAAISVMANIAEGFSRKSNKEFIQFLYVSKSSAAEIQSHLYVALDQGYIAKAVFTEVYKQAEKISRMESNFIKYLNSLLNKK